MHVLGFGSGLQVVQAPAKQVTITRDSLLDQEMLLYHFFFTKLTCQRKDKQKLKKKNCLTGTAQDVHFNMCTLLHILLLLFLASFLLAPVLVLH